MLDFFKRTACFILCMIMVLSVGTFVSADENNISVVCDNDTNLYTISGCIEAAKATNIVSVEVVSGGMTYYANTLYTNEWGEFVVEFFMPDYAQSGEYTFRCMVQNSENIYEKEFYHTKKDKYVGVKIYENAYKGVYDRANAGFGVYAYNPTVSKEYRVMYSITEKNIENSVTLSVPAGKVVKNWIDLSYLPNGIYTLKRKIVDETGAFVVSETSQSITIINYYRDRKLDSELSRIGMNVRLYENNAEASNVMLTYMELLGVKNARIGQGVGFTWENIEAEEGIYDFSAMNENYLARLKADNINIMGAIGGNVLYGANGIPTDENIGAYKSFIKALTENIDNLDILEVWNEPDISRWFSDNISEYVRLTKNSGIASNALGTDVEIVSGAVSSGGHEYNKTIFGNGVYPYIDGYSFHPYLHDTRKAGLFANIDASNSGYDYRSWVTNYHYNAEKNTGGWIKRYNSEIGWPVSDLSSITLDDQATNLVKTLVYDDYLGINKSYWYNLRDTGMDSSDNEQMFGIISGANKTKPAFVALSQLVNELNNAVYIGKYPANCEAYVYYADGELFMLAWTTDKDKTDVLEFGNDVLVYDINGNQTQQSSRSTASTNTVNISYSPVYIKNIDYALAVEAVKNEVGTSDAKYYLNDIKDALKNSSVTSAEIKTLLNSLYSKGDNVMSAWGNNAYKADLLWDIHKAGDKLASLYIASAFEEDMELSEISSENSLKEIISKRNSVDERKGYVMPHTDKMIKIAEDYVNLAKVALSEGCVSHAIIYDEQATQICRFAEMFMEKESVESILLTNPEFKITFKGFVDKNGNSIDEIADNDVVIAKYEIDNTGNASRNFVMPVASYKNGVLNSVEMIDASVTGWENVSVECELKGGDTLKVMIFDSITNLMPLTSAETLIKK